MLLDMKPPSSIALDPKNTLTGDSGAKAADPTRHDAPVNVSSGSRRLAGVNTLTVSSKQRIILAKDAPYTILAQDSDANSNKVASNILLVNILD